MKKGLLLIVVFFIFPSLSSAFEWQELGRAPLMREITDLISLQEKFSLHKAEIVKGLEMAEPDWDAQQIADCLEAGILSGKVKEISFPPGKKFLWMIFKPRGKISVVRDVKWMGKKETLTLKGFLLICKNYQEEELKFFLAKKCGNLALLERSSLPQKSKAVVYYYPFPSSIYYPRLYYPRVYYCRPRYSYYSYYWPSVRAVRPSVRTIPSVPRVITRPPQVITR